MTKVLACMLCLAFAVPCRAQAASAAPEDRSSMTLYDVLRSQQTEGQGFRSETSSEETELQQLDKRIAALTAQRRSVRLGWPIALTAMGGGALIFAVPVLLEVEYRTQDDGKAVLWTYAAFGCVGVPLAVAGGILLASRVRSRRALLPELRALKERRRILHQSLYSARLSVTDGGAAAAITLGF